MGNISTYLESSSGQSSMRLAMLIIILSGALVALAVVFAIIWYACHQIPIPGAEIGAALAGDAAYTGAGVAGKAWQKNIEEKAATRNYTTPPQSEFQG